MRNMIAKVTGCPAVMKYLPDADELTEKSVSKEFLCTVINTVDPRFFPSVIAKAERRRRELMPRGGENQIIRIDESLLDVLKQHVRS